MSSLDTAAESSLATLVTFLYGSSAARYTTHLNPIIAGDGTFAPEPSIEVTLGAQHGGSADVPVQIRMKMRQPLEALTTQRAHAPVRVRIEEVDPSDLSTRRVLFAGIVRMSDRSIDGQSGVVRLEIAGWKHSLEVASNGWQANTTCNSFFGDSICGVDLAAIREAASVDALEGNLVTLDGLTTVAVAGYWRFGYLEYEGLRIKVREYTTGSQLTLLRAPPAAWLNQTITATPGCDKRLATCRDRWNNEARFSGFGLKIPAYNPLLEST